MHHRAVPVSLNIVLELLDWRVQSNMTTLTSWHARRSILRETFSELLCLVRVEEVDKGKTVTGALFEVHWHVNKVEMTAESQVGERLTQTVVVELTRQILDHDGLFLTLWD